MYTKQPKQQLKIVDNFLESPGLWKEYALKQEYFTDASGYPGKKTKALDEIHAGLFHSLAAKIIGHVNGKQGFSRLKIQFAYTSSTNFTSNIHQDEPFYNVAGIIYLNENAPNNTGTKFYNLIDGLFVENINIENHYNRMIIFDPSKWHAPSGTFGDELSNGRITITFFGIAV